MYIPEGRDTLVTIVTRTTVHLILVFGLIVTSFSDIGA